MEHNALFVFSGAAGYVQCDFGPSHTVRDADGEPVRSAIVVGVEQVCGWCVNEAIPAAHYCSVHGFDFEGLLLAV